MATNTAIVSAEDSLKKCLQNVKVSRDDAKQLEASLENELFRKWEEKFESSYSRSIPIKEIDQFLDAMQAGFEGIDESTRKKMNLIKYAGGNEYKLVEWKFNARGSSGARYGMMAFGKSPDGQEVDCMYVLYKMDFEIAQYIRHPYMDSLLMLDFANPWTVNRHLSNTERKQFKNFFRLKALECFCTEGLLDHITYVNSIQDVQDE